jgi:hypothetical protein
MTTPGHVAELLLERYRLGELPEPEAQALRAALEANPALRARLLGLERSDAELLREHPVLSFVHSVRSRAGDVPERVSTGRRALLLLPASVLAAALAALTLGVLPGPAPSTSSPRAVNTAPADGDRSKGDGPDLLLFTRRNDRIVEQLASGATTREGDVIQVAYRGGSRGYGVILSIDGRGRVTRHFPLTGDAAGPLRRGGAATLDIAYKLDDAPRAERFYFVTANEPFALDQALLAARKPGLDPLTSDRLILPSSFGQASFLLKKD